LRKAKLEMPYCNNNSNSHFRFQSEVSKKSHMVEVTRERIQALKSENLLFHFCGTTPDDTYQLFYHFTTNHK